MKYASVYLNPSADRNPREKGKEQQIRGFAECQHSNDSEKYKTKQLTTQGNKCSCGKNHTLMPISLIALWFRQRAERQGVWALCAAVLQPGCHLGGWILALPLAIFAFSFATCQCKMESRLSRGCQTPTEARSTCRKPCCWMKGFTRCMHTLVQGTGLSPCVVSPLPSRSLSTSWRWVKVSSTCLQRFHTLCPVQTPTALVFFYWLLGLWGLNLRAKRSKKKK